SSSARTQRQRATRVGLVVAGLLVAGTVGAGAVLAVSSGPHGSAPTHVGAASTDSIASSRRPAPVPSRPDSVDKGPVARPSPGRRKPTAVGVSATAREDAAKQARDSAERLLESGDYTEAWNSARLANATALMSRIVSACRQDSVIAARRAA